MKQENSYFKSSNSIKGVYGDFIVTSNDKKEVLFYRLSILFCGLFFSIGIAQWFTMDLIKYGFGYWHVNKYGFKS